MRGNSMNNIDHRRLRLAARNEGKIKTYESCVDVRAWSHDIGTRNRYLRDWIKCNMPICVVPVYTLSSILTMMTCGSRGKLSPRCYSRCQSKVLLQRLCSSCTIMKECLSHNTEFEKYFREEELYSINWPCDKCLEILKSIKMFWKIVVEKVLKINLPTTNVFKCAHFCSIKNIAKEWQKEMVEQALFVQSNTPLCSQVHIKKTKSDCSCELQIKRQDKCFNNKYQNKETKTDCEFRAVSIQMDTRSMCQKINKCISASIKTGNLECKSKHDKENEVIMLYKNNIQNLQDQYNVQKIEVDRLKKENVALNDELQRCRQQYTKKLNQSFDKTVALFSDPENSKDDFNEAKDIDSEMIITLKNCKNENFRHVSVIQVLHKTNEITMSEVDDPYIKAEDPIDILNKVHERFATMVNREFSIACKTDSSFKNKNVVIKSTFRNVSETRSTPSCCMSSYSFTSESKFESANEAVINS